MWSTWLVLGLTAWVPTSAPAPVSVFQVGAPRSTAIATGAGVVVLWTDGDVRIRPWSHDPDHAPGVAPAAPAAVPLPGARHGRAPVPEPLPEPPGAAAVAGDVPAAQSALVLTDGAQAVLLIDGAALAYLTGPALLRRDDGALVVVDGAAPQVVPLDGYREGPSPTLPPGVSAAPVDDAGLDVGLVLLSPAATTLRDPRPVIRWRWPEPDARFDVTVLRLGGDGDAPADREDAGQSSGGTVVERWRAVAGRSLALWAPLARGARYRVTVNVSGARPLGRGLSAHLSFSILGDVAADAVAGSLAALAALAHRGPGVRPEIEVLRARLLESYGLLADAERVWAALALLFPGHTELPHQARRLHHAIRGR